MSKTHSESAWAVSTPWQDIVLVCRKCSKKLDGGFGADGQETLARALKQTLRQAGRRQTVRVIETKCLGLCPRGAVSLLRGSRPGMLLAVRPGADPGALLAAS